jgi:protoheme IX farnesyltransferase
MVALSAAAGYLLGARGSGSLVALLHTILGTGLVAAGASALNQVLERDTDALMRRTQSRPLPAGRLDTFPALWFGVGISIVGAAYLALAVNPLTAVIGTITLLLYVLAYTPLKRVSPLCTVVGAVPGALPPVMGWTAATGHLSGEAWVLFAILFLWQMPHFLAIAWMYCDDYRRAGQPMLPVIDADGRRTGRQIVLYGLGLVPVSLLPSLIGMTGPVYLIGALLLSLAYLVAGLYAAQTRTIESARLLLRVSVIYLPVLLGLMTLAKVPL